MAELQEVFGQNYNVESCLQRVNYSAKILAVNIAKLNFKLRHASDSLWNGNNMRPEALRLIINKVQEVNPKFRIECIDKTSKTVNMFPYLIDGAVEYFRIVDLDRKRIYLIYVTPINMEPY